MKNTLFARIAVAFGLLGAVVTSPAANIVWVSDASPAGFSGPGVGMTDQGFVALLQNAGHNVIRFNPPDSSATALTPAEIAALNTNDLVIIGRSVGSGAFQNPPQVTNWNVDITKPLMTINAYLSRRIRLGWFVGSTQNDDTPTKVTVLDPTNPKVDYVFGGVPMIGNTTVSAYDELIDRNTSQLTDQPVVGGTLYATANYPVDNGTAGTASIFADFPAGTAVLGGSNLLGGYRLYFAAASRESAAAPNAVNQNAGRENMTPTGESLFLRAVQLALNNGVPPTVDPATPVAIVVPPTNATVSIGDSVTISVAVTGAAPRTLQWQRDIGDATTFTNIPDAFTTFSASTLTLSNLTPADFDQARFRAVVSNPNNTVNSDVAVLTVLNDTSPPVPISAGSVDGASIEICFNEILDTNVVNNAATENFSYSVDDDAVGVGLPITISADGKSVKLPLLNPIGPSFTVRISAVADRFGNAIPDPGVTLVGTNLGLTTVDVGALNPAGTNAFCGGNTLQIYGGGLDVAAASDQLRFAYKAVSGDFDARVRVLSLTGTNRLEAVAKALLTAREGNANNSAAVNVFVTTATPGDNSISSRYRTATGAAYTTNTPAYSSTNSPQISPGGLPNAWMRIKRVGNQFTTYRGTNGIDWVEMDNASIPLAADLNVGLGTVSHRNTVLAIGTFSDFKIGPVINPPVLTNSISTNGVFSASFGTQAGVGYTVQFRDVVNTGSWNTLTNLSGDGSTQSFLDPGPVSPTGNRFYKVGAQ